MTTKEEVAEKLAAVRAKVAAAAGPKLEGSRDSFSLEEKAVLESDFIRNYINDDRNVEKVENLGIQTKFEKGEGRKITGIDEEGLESLMKMAHKYASENNKILTPDGNELNGFNAEITKGSQSNYQWRINLNGVDDIDVPGKQLNSQEKIEIAERMSKPGTDRALLGVMSEARNITTETIKAPYGEGYFEKAQEYNDAINKLVGAQMGCYDSLAHDVNKAGKHSTQKDKMGINGGQVSLDDIDKQLADVNKTLGTNLTAVYKNTDGRVAMIVDGNLVEKNEDGTGKWKMIELENGKKVSAKPNDTASIMDTGAHALTEKRLELSHQNEMARANTNTGNNLAKARTHQERE